jgi:hypothetical protein
MICLAQQIDPQTFIAVINECRMLVLEFETDALFFLRAEEMSLLSKTIC